MPSIEQVTGERCRKGPSRYRKKRPLIKDKLLPLLEALGHIQGPRQRAEIQGKMRREAYRVIRRLQRGEE